MIVTFLMMLICMTVQTILSNFPHSGKVYFRHSHSRTDPELASHIKLQRIYLSLHFIIDAELPPLMARHASNFSDVSGIAAPDWASQTLLCIPATSCQPIADTLANELSALRSDSRFLSWDLLL